MQDTNCDTRFQTGELGYMTRGFILKDENRSEHRPGVWDWGQELTVGNENEKYK